MPWKGVLPDATAAVSFLLLVGIPASKLLSFVVPEAQPGTPTVVLIVTTVVGFMTVVVQQAFSAWTIKQNRIADMEDREAKARILLQQQKIQMEILERATLARQAEIRLIHANQEDAARQRQTDHQTVESMLDRNLTATNEGTKAATQAFKEANQVNQKIADMQMQALSARDNLPADTGGLPDVCPIVSIIGSNPDVKTINIHPPGSAPEKKND